MRWSTWEEKRAYLYEWHQWFAWHPVVVGTEWVWLERVERRARSYWGGPNFEYQEVNHAMQTLDNAPKTTSRVLSATEIMNRSLSMTDQAEQAERILAALREPSEAVLDAAANAPHEHRHPDVPTLAEKIRAAVAAAEEEVGI